MRASLCLKRVHASRYMSLWSLVAFIAGRIGYQTYYLRYLRTRPELTFVDLALLPRDLIFSNAIPKQ